MGAKMIESIHFKNFKILKDTTLPLSRFTLIVGPNGSGKSTAMQALLAAGAPHQFNQEIITAGLKGQAGTTVKIEMRFRIDQITVFIKSGWHLLANGSVQSEGPSVLPSHPNMQLSNEIGRSVWDALGSFRVFSFNADSISAPVALSPNMRLEPDGANLAGVLDNLRDGEPERFEALNDELGRWLPEFDRILFEIPSKGGRAFLLRTRKDKLKIHARDLSHGTLFALAFLTLAYLPNPPAIMCFEEPERGIHPRLLRDVRDAMYRLCYPEEHGESRSPVQVIATTHSPYLLDLYKDQPQEVVIAHKDDKGVHFERLSEKPDFDEILRGAPLGEVWYSGILGGVPANS
jgi:predicted ATPase